MDQVICPHCGAENVPGSAFCASCGKALPAAVRAGPRVVSGAAVPTTAAGMKLRTDELQKQAKSATGALLAVAVIQTVVGTIVIAAVESSSNGRVDPTILCVTLFGVAAVFWGLYIWSKWAPLPAAIVGLVIYVTLWAVDIVAGVMAIQHAQGGTPGGQGGPDMLTASPFSGIVVRILIIVVLVRAVKAGAQHRRLVREQAPGFPVVP